MSTTHLARRLRGGLALAAGAALLGLTACGTDAAPDTGDDAPPAASDAGGGQPADDSDEDTGTDEDADDGADDSTDDDTSEDDGTSDDETSDEGDSDDSNSDDGGSDEDTDAGGTTGERTSVLLVTEYDIDDGHGEGDPILSAEDLAGLLTGTLGGEAQCDGELTLSIHDLSSVQCEGPAGIEGEETSEWTASPIQLPSEDAGLESTHISVIFTTGTEFPPGAADLQDENVVVTGVGMGSMFGAEPLSAEELSEATLQTLTSDNAYVPVDTMANWDEVTCEDGMDFTEFRTVDCEATTESGDTYPLHIAPGTFVENDQGLLVGIVTR